MSTNSDFDPRSDDERPRCPNCGSLRVGESNGLGWCESCDWEGEKPEGDGGEDEQSV